MCWSKHFIQLAEDEIGHTCTISPLAWRNTGPTLPMQSNDHSPQGRETGHLVCVRESFFLNCCYQPRATCTVFSFEYSAHNGSWRYFVVKYRKAVRRETPWTCISGRRERARERERTLGIINSNRAMTVNREESVCELPFISTALREAPTSSHLPPTPPRYLMKYVQGKQRWGWCADLPPPWLTATCPVPLLIYKVCRVSARVASLASLHAIKALS